MNIENELREALRRKQAPADLADRVLARARERSEQPATRLNTAAATAGKPGTSRVVMRWLAAAAVLAATAGGAERYYTQQRAAEAARVEQEIRIALQITSETLARVQSKLSEPADDAGR